MCQHKTSDMRWINEWRHARVSQLKPDNEKPVSLLLVSSVHISTTTKLLRFHLLLSFKPKIILVHWADNPPFASVSLLSLYALTLFIIDMIWYMMICIIWGNCLNSLRRCSWGVCDNPWPTVKDIALKWKFCFTSYIWLVGNSHIEVDVSCEQTAMPGNWCLHHCIWPLYWTSLAAMH
jgi:hypothetical protein